MKSLLFALIALLVISIANQAKAQDKTESRKVLLDSLESRLPYSNSDTNHVKLLTGLSFYYNIIDTDKGLEYGFEGIELANKLNWEQGAGACYNSIGINYKAKGDIKNAKRYFKMALAINKKLNIKKELMFNYLNLGIVNAAETNNSIAVDYLKQGLAISKELKNEYYISFYIMALGDVQYNQSNYPLALEYYHDALLRYQSINNKNKVAFIVGRIGQIHLYLSNVDNALDYLNKAIKLNNEIGNKIYEANNIGNIGIIYYDQSDYQRALEYYFKALKKYKDIEHKPGISVYLGNIGNVYKRLKKYDKASEYYKQAITINKEIGRKDGLAHNYNDYGEMILNIYYEKNANINNKDSELFRLSNVALINKSLEYLKKSNQLFLKATYAVELSDNFNNLHKAYFEKGDYKESIIAHRKFKQIQDSIFSKNNREKIASLENKRLNDLNLVKLEKQEIRIAAQEKEKELIVFSASGGIFSIVLILGIIINQRRTSDKLLYNVLPVTIAKRLKKKEHPISDYFTQASIVFIDIVGFTSMSMDVDPRDIVIELNKIFTKYDSISKKYGLEKIKTIGDSYMAAAGIPEVQKDNTHRAAQMALEVKAMMSDYHTADGTKIEVRIGLDCGPVVAGVIGENKFIYDMWSDAVNTASRMESSSIAGQVHVSERFKEAVSEYEEFVYVERGEIEIKGKGKMKTYFIEDRKVEVV